MKQRPAIMTALRGCLLLQQALKAVLVGKTQKKRAWVIQNGINSVLSDPGSAVHMVISSTLASKTRSHGTCTIDRLHCRACWPAHVICACAPIPAQASTEVIASLPYHYLPLSALVWGYVRLLYEATSTTLATWCSRPVAAALLHFCPALVSVFFFEHVQSSVIL